MQPIPLYPMIAGFTVGVFGEWLNIPAHYSMITVMFLIVTQLEFLVICFEKKHQTISASLDTFKINQPLRVFGYFLCVLCNFVMCIWFHFERLTKDEQWNWIRTKSGIRDRTDINKFSESCDAIIPLEHICYWKNAMMSTVFALNPF
ncbi:hypothetical protein GCK72_006950 [Caenorhabditis remanei]|uniref:Uncharacterized protein n=1 Tax=Caenorhabditis remanei TaxID=31234 RepID=A0A6A5HMF2_CAERE|nr:hypothetical protein GCK72_006950 [Caenorhabditis remanei]KAF1766992.1 hypothetical protein GCK72_006950 [Caenorhabditis remanei]